MANRLILIILAYGLLCACATRPTGESREPFQVTEKHESKIGNIKQLELKAFLNERGTVSLHINNNSAVDVGKIMVGLRLRNTARIVSNTTFTVPQGVSAGQSLLVDTEIVVPVERSILRAQVIKANFLPRQ